MFHKASKLDFKEGTRFELSFQDGTVKSYDMASLFDKYPQLRALDNRDLFLSGKLIGSYGIMWNDDLDIEAETVYEDGMTVRKEASSPFTEVGNVIMEARANAGLSQKDLSDRTGIDQSDISKLERGIANPSIGTLSRIADALGCFLNISMLPK